MVRPKVARNLFRGTVLAACLVVGTAIVSASTFAVLDRAYPSVPLLAKIDDYSVEVLLTWVVMLLAQPAKKSQASRISNSSSASGKDCWKKFLIL